MGGDSVILCIILLFCFGFALLCYFGEKDLAEKGNPDNIFSKMRKYWWVPWLIGLILFR